MLSQLLSSKPKTKLINLFLAHAGRSFSMTELRINSGCSGKLLKQTLRELDKIEFLIISGKNRVKYYQMNKHFALYPELLSLLRKVKSQPTDNLLREAAKIGNCKLIALTGVFVGKPRMETDLLFVGKISTRRLSGFLKLAERYAEQEINYTIFTTQEYEYRNTLNDRFLKNILENKPVFAVDRTKNRSMHKVGYKL